jgi:hypothetical protein
VKSAEFRRWWPQHDVRAKSHGRKRLHHPIVGDPDQVLITYTAHGSESETVLRLLGSVAEPARPAERQPEGWKDEGVDLVTS